VAIFVHGCFWHCHGCKDSTIPKSNVAFWKQKLLSNKERDSEVIKELNGSGWLTIVLWECELTKARRKETFDNLNEKLSFLLTNTAKSV
jgi:DNA mismatch endonuclease (patch repair protein)